MTKTLKGDTIFKIIAGIIAASALVILLINAYILITGSETVFARFGLDFVTGKNWNAVEGRESFGLQPYILGTLVTSGIALLIGVPLSLGIAIFLVEMAPRSIRVPVSYLVELLAAVPSVIFGLWGIFVLRSWVVNNLEIPLNTYLGWIPIFSGTPFGFDFFTAGIILAIMIFPQSRRFPEKSSAPAQLHPRRRLQYRRHKMGSHPPLGAQLRTLRNLWCNNFGFRQSSRRNHGGHYGYRQCGWSSSYAYHTV